MLKDMSLFTKNYETIGIQDLLRDSSTTWSQSQKISSWAPVVSLENEVDDGLWKGKQES